MEALEAAKARWEVFNLGESHGGSSIILNSWLVYFMEKNDHEGWFPGTPRNPRNVGIWVAKMGGKGRVDQDDDEARRREASEALLLGSSSLEKCTKRSVCWFNDPKKYADFKLQKGTWPFDVAEGGFYMHCLVLPSRKVHTFAKANFGAGANPGAFTREGEGHVAESVGIWAHWVSPYFEMVMMVVVMWTWHISPKRWVPYRPQALGVTKTRADGFPKTAMAGHWYASPKPKHRIRTIIFRLEFE